MTDERAATRADRSSERTTVAATYTTRRDAEIAQERLEEEGVDAFISADDAGGMHPHLQERHGVKLVVLEGDAAQARRVLEEAALLPEATGAAGAGHAQVRREEQGEAAVLSSKKLRFWGAVVLAAALILSFLLLTVGELV